MLFRSVFLSWEILGVHVQLSKCWRSTWSEKGWEPAQKNNFVVFLIFPYTLILNIELSSFQDSKNKNFHHDSPCSRRVSVLSCIIQPGGNRTSTSGAFPSLAPNQQIWATAPTSGQTIVSSPSPGDGKTGPDLVLVKSASEKPSAGDSDVAATEEVAKNEGFIGPEAGHEPNAGKSAADKHSYSSLPDVPSLDKDREIAGEQQSSPGVAEEDGLLVPKEPNDTQVGPETEPVAHVRDPASPLLGGVDKCEVAKDPSLVREPEVADSGSPGVPDRNQSGGIHSDPGDQTNATAGVHANPSENTAERSESDEQSEKTAAGKSSDSSDNVTATQQDDDVVLVKKEVTNC